MDRYLKHLGFEPILGIGIEVDDLGDQQANQFC